MITYELREDVTSPLYAQLYEYIRMDIVNGHLKAHDKLPSKRHLANHLQISVITVTTAYEQLMAEGYIYTKPRRGYYVMEQIVRGDTPTIKEVVYKREASTVTAPPSYRLDLTANDTPQQAFPFSVWSKLMRHRMSYGQEELMATSPPAGVYALRRAVAGYLRVFRNMPVEANQIIIGAGTEYLYTILIHLLQQDYVYCLENPGYSKLSHIYKQHQRTCTYARLDEEGVVMDDIMQADPQVLHLSPSHHFPTGKVTSIGRRQELLQWAAASADRYIIEDDYDSEFRLTGRLIPTLASIDTSQSVIYMNTFSKSLASTIRISYMVLPPSLMNIYHETMTYCSSTVSNFEQYTLADLIEQGYFERHINRMRTYYRKQRQQVIHTMKASSLYPYLKIQENSSGLHYVITLATTMSDKEFIKRCHEKGIHIKALSEYYQKNTHSDICTHQFIVNYSNIDIDALQWGLEEMYAIIAGK